MKKSTASLLFLVPIGMLAACVRELEGASCPCVAGWTCCEEQNICRADGEDCNPHEDEDVPSLAIGDADTVCRTASSCTAEDTTTIGRSYFADGGSDESQAVCDTSREPDTLVCPGAPFVSLPAATKEATSVALLGRWQVCGGKNIGWGERSSESDGIEFTSDGHYFLLKRNAQGALERFIGVYSAGTYEVGLPDDEQDMAVRLTGYAGGYWITEPSFAAANAHLHLALGGEFDPDYVRVAEGASSVPGVVIPGACRQPGSTDADAGASLEPVCDGFARALMCPGGPFAFARLDPAAALEPVLVGRWQVCEGTGFRWGPDDAHSGIEFTSDGEFFLLGLDAEGGLRRVTGVHSAGTYEVRVSDVDSRDRDVEFIFSDGGAAYFWPTFDSTKTHMFAGPDTGNSSYVQVPTGADSTAGIVVQAACGSRIDDPFEDFLDAGVDTSADAAVDAGLPSR